MGNWGYSLLFTGFWAHLVGYKQLLTWNRKSCMFGSDDVPVRTADVLVLSEVSRV